MNQYAMHNMVEYIKTQAEFPFDALDVDESLEAILGYFGFHPQLDGSEREQLRQDLYPLALGAELGEMQHLAEAEGMEELESVGKPLGMWLRVLGRQQRSVTPARFMEKMRLA
jgi:hypothetical protein